MTETSPSYGPLLQSGFDSQYRRILAAAECQTQTQLAEVLEISQSSVSDAKRREKIPADWLITLLTKKRINPAWILMGQGEMLLRPAKAHRPFSSPVAGSTTDELLAELARRVMKCMD